MVKTSKTGSKVAVSVQKGAEITNTPPQRGHGNYPAVSQQSATASTSPSILRRSEAGPPTIPPSSDYPPSVSFQLGPGFSGAPILRGTESRSKSEAYRHSSVQRKIQQAQTSASPAIQMQRNVSPPKEESTRRGGESKSGCDRYNRYSLTPDARSSRHLSFADQKDNAQIVQEDDTPSKVQYPQGVRVSRRTLIFPKDEAVQTEPTRKSVTAAEIKFFPRRPCSPEHGSSRVCADTRTAQRRTPSQEPETGRHSSIYPEPKALHRNINLASSLRLSVLKDNTDGGHRVSLRTEPESVHKHSAYTETKSFPKVLISSEVEPNMKSSMRGDSEGGRRVTISSEVQTMQPAHRVTSRAVSESPHKSSMVATPEPVYKQHTQRPSESVCTSSGPSLRYPEPSRKPSVHAKLELSPRPLPPRALPRYGPESSWWALLNPEAEMPQSWPTAPDFEPKSPPPLDPLLSFFEMDSSPFCEDLMFQREKASPAAAPAAPAAPLPSPKEPPSQAPLKEVSQAPQSTTKQPIQRFSAFFLDVSEEMYNRIIWWLEGLCFSLLWVHCGGLGGRRTGGKVASMCLQS
ncbi:PREDICTED: septin-4 isoform X1 [Hipposideros armiger]|uniref:Septin-4 isoform X1 n=1 Tax=Hipposideros armiger TaxID=186990 RepID=A0A8B7QWL5_HIPAR|nr:PREDICTED: septin-4 isoform X1 [Hipposideros armiger]